MAAIVLTMRGRQSSKPRSEGRPGQGATITIFPGVRYERLPDDHVFASFERKGKSGSRGRLVRGLQADGQQKDAS
ncbi:hypothetical protein GCM10023174_01390 [Chelativorans composti]|jgi:hypothetical protein|uniref:Uncharacterized protein n=1 Tax=Chelativorans composti TaxID=768533 RepID=A0ABW5DHA9_9HYPH